MLLKKIKSKKASGELFMLFVVMIIFILLAFLMPIWSTFLNVHTIENNVNASVETIMTNELQSDAYNEYKSSTSDLSDEVRFNSLKVVVDKINGTFYTDSSFGPTVYSMVADSLNSVISNSTSQWSESGKSIQRKTVDKNGNSVVHYEVTDLGIDETYLNEIKNADYLRLSENEYLKDYISYSSDGNIDGISIPITYKIVYHEKYAMANRDFSVDRGLTLVYRLE